jgi:hypothetical protein
MSIKYTLICLSIVISIHSFGQINQGMNCKTKLGLSLGYGTQSLITENYDYKIKLVNFQYSRKLMGNNDLGVDIVLSPHFVSVNFKPNIDINSYNSSFEFGLNGGFLIRKNIVDSSLYTYFLFSVGPHFITDAPDRQRMGFIFSDNAAFGLLFKIERDVYLDLRLGIRHISNANTRLPNSGINNLIFNLGVVFPLK